LQGKFHDEALQVFSSPSFQLPQRGRQITACRDWWSKNETAASSLVEVCFFDSHIRATNAPASHPVNLKNPEILSKRKNNRDRPPILSSKKENKLPLRVSAR
jgi:hypothetical protein